jgi:hypothetical protein
LIRQQTVDTINEKLAEAHRQVESEERAAESERQRALAAISARTQLPID